MADDDTTELDVKKARAEAAAKIVKSVAEVVRNLGIVAALIAGLWANCSKASKDETKESYALTRDAIGALNEQAQDQHDTTEKLKEAVGDQGEAVKTIASSAPSAAIPVSPKPVERGCWVGPGGVVRCKKVAEAASAARPAVSLPKSLPPSPKPPPINLPEPREAFDK